MRNPACSGSSFDPGSKSLPRNAVIATLAALSLIVSLFVGPSRSEAATSHNPYGYIGTLAFINGYLIESGWAVDPDANVPLRMERWTDGRLSGAFSANLNRPDLASLPFGPNHGYYQRTAVAAGTHTECLIGINVGAGVNTNYGCRTIVVDNDPFGAITTLQLVPGGVQLAGWVIDPNQAAATQVSIYLNNGPLARVPAQSDVPSLATKYPYYGTKHGFDVTYPFAEGPQNLCVYGWNTQMGTNKLLACRSITVSRSPIGAITALQRVGNDPTLVSLSGWAFDPDSAGIIGVRITSDGSYVTAAQAASPVASVGTSYPVYGANHGFGGMVNIDSGQHVVCVVAVNIGLGADKSLGCKTLLSTGDTTPAPPTNLVAWPGNGQVSLTWTAAVSKNAPITSYLVHIGPTPHIGIAVAAGATSVTIGGLTNGGHYLFAVEAYNSFGKGSAANSGQATPSIIPPQFTPAPVSTSHYVRNLTGNATTDTALMTSMGSTDAGYNPSNHRYLVLLQIGGQDESRGGVLLSATSKFVSYPAVVTAMKAYLDGYVTRQKAYAPMTLAIGTNNDVDVSSAAGASWARNVVTPVRAYAARYPSVSVSGANDIEPGFSATVAQSRAWVSGYLASTSAPFVFNGSADGCSTVAAASRCNNGWTMADLQWISGGAAPTRITSLPQIYNTAMPLQWKYISLTGVNARMSKLAFSGPLTEVTACAQAGSCGSMSNVEAWNRLWSAISSLPQTKQYDMPNGTDLRIN